MDTKITNGIAVVITSVWATSFIADIFVNAYDPSAFVHMIMMGLAGSAFGRSFFPRDKEQEQEPAHALD